MSGGPLYFCFVWFSCRRLLLVLDVDKANSFLITLIIKDSLTFVHFTMCVQRQRYLPIFSDQIIYLGRFNNCL